MVLASCVGRFPDAVGGVRFDDFLCAGLGAAHFSLTSRVFSYTAHPPLPALTFSSF